MHTKTKIIMYKNENFECNFGNLGTNVEFGKNISLLSLFTYLFYLANSLSKYLAYDIQQPA